MDRTILSERFNQNGRKVSETIDCESLRKMSLASNAWIGVYPVVFGFSIARRNGGQFFVSTQVVGQP